MAQNYIKTELTSGGTSVEISGYDLSDGGKESHATCQFLAGTDAGAYSIELQASAIVPDQEPDADISEWVAIGTYSETDLKLFTLRISRWVNYRVHFSSGTHSGLTVVLRG